MVASSVLMRFSEVADNDWSIHRAHNLSKRDLIRWSGKDIAAAHASLRADDAGTFEGQQDLLQIWLGERGAFRNVSHRGWVAIGMQRERQQGSARIVASGGHLHGGHPRRYGACWAALCEVGVRREVVGSARGSVSFGFAGRIAVDQLVLPDYSGACISNIVPALLDGGADEPAWMPEIALDASQVVLLVLDGLGWEQLQERKHLAPCLSSMTGGPITSVSPSTTATALTSIATGTPPGEHGVVGYRVAVNHDVLNILRWFTPGGDARVNYPPQEFQTIEPFCCQRPAMVTKAEFSTSAFSDAHLAGTRFRGYRVPSTMVVEIRRALKAGEPFVYAYYDGIDKVSHEYGLAEHFDAEIAAVDHLVSEIMSVLPQGACLMITADHGQVDVGDRIITPHADILLNTSFQSGEGRFRWFHARPGRERDLLAAAEQHHSDVAWVRSKEQTIDELWWGPVVSNEARSRLGDVALVAREPVSFHDPADSGPFELIGRHGSLTSAEMYVPLLVGVSQ